MHVPISKILFGKILTILQLPTRPSRLYLVLVMVQIEALYSSVMNLKNSRRQYALVDSIDTCHPMGE